MRCRHINVIVSNVFFSSHQNTFILEFISPNFLFFSHLTLHIFHSFPLLFIICVWINLNWAIRAICLFPQMFLLWQWKINWVYLTLNRVVAREIPSGIQKREFNLIKNTPKPNPLRSKNYWDKKIAQNEIRLCAKVWLILQYMFFSLWLGTTHSVSVGLLRVCVWVWNRTCTSFLWWGANSHTDYQHTIIII